MVAALTCVLFSALQLSAKDASADEFSPVESWTQAMKLMKEKEYDAALPVLEAIRAELRESTGTLTGTLALVEYHIGYCHLAMKRYKEAAAAFKESYMLTATAEEKEWVRAGCPVTPKPQE